MQSMDELEELRTSIEELRGQIKKSPDLAKRTVMRNLGTEVNFLMQGEQA